MKDGVLFATLLKHLLALEGVVADINLDSINNDNEPDDNVEHKPRNPLDRLREFFKAMKSSNASKHAYLPPTINSAGVCFEIFWKNLSKFNFFYFFLFRLLLELYQQL